MKQHKEIPYNIFSSLFIYKFKALNIIKSVKDRLQLPVLTDVHTAEECAKAADYVDVLQIPAFLCRQTDLLVAAGKTGKIIQIKKGQFCGPGVMTHSANKIRSTGNDNIIVCDRGTMFGYHDLIVDPRNLVLMRKSGCKVSMDITHSLQQPGQKKSSDGSVQSGGLRELIPTIGRMAVAVGVDGIFMEVHDNPVKSKCDAPTQWPLNRLEELLVELVAISKVSKGKD